MLKLEITLQINVIIIVAKPDGGNGGKGGDVHFKSSEKLTSLYDLRRAHFLGNNGGHGRVIIIILIFVLCV